MEPHVRRQYEAAVVEPEHLLQGHDGLEVPGSGYEDATAPSLVALPALDGAAAPPLGRHVRRLPSVLHPLRDPREAYALVGAGGEVEPALPQPSFAAFQRPQPVGPVGLAVLEEVVEVPGPADQYVGIVVPDVLQEVPEGAAAGEHVPLGLGDLDCLLAPVYAEPQHPEGGRLLVQGRGERPYASNPAAPVHVGLHLGEGDELPVAEVPLGVGHVHVVECLHVLGGLEVGDDAAVPAYVVHLDA